jgi:outer membrane receptor protein involved in Fe transport
VSRSFRLLVVLLSCVALAEPKAGFLHTPPAELAPNVDYTLEGSLTGDGLSTVSVKLRVPGRAYESIALELQYGDLYRAIIPRDRIVPPAIEYYIEGTTKLGEVVTLFGSGLKPIRVTVPGVAPAEPKPVEPAPEPPVEAKPEAPRQKCVKTKKGKKCVDESAPVAEVKPPPEPEPAPPPEPAKVEPKRPPDDGRPAKAEPRRAADEPKPTSPSTAKRADAKAEPPRKRSELEEELAVYSAEETGAVVQKVDEASSRSVHHGTVLTLAHLKQLGVRYVFEALDLVPGLSVSRDVQGTFTLGVRGIRSEPDVLFLLNGQRLNTFYDGKALANLPIDTFERIEILRGPATADVGLGNFTAVINLVSNRQQGLRASATGGMFSAFDGHLSAAKTFGGLTLFADGDVVSQQGARTRVPRDGLDTTATPTTEKFTNDRRFLVNAGLGASYESDAVGKLTLQGRLMTERRAAYIGRFDTVGNDSQLDWLVVQAQLGWERRLGDAGKASVRLWFDRQATTRAWQLTPDGFQFRATMADTLFPDGAFEEQRVTQLGLGMDGRADFILPAKNTLTVGISGGFETLTDYALLSNYVPLSSSARYRVGALERGVNLDGTEVAYPTQGASGVRGQAADRVGIGLFVYDTWSPFDALAVQGGLRFDLTQLPAQADGAFVGRTFVPSFGPRLGVALAPVKPLVLRANYGRSFRVPTVLELSESAINSDFNQGRFVGNPRLTGAYLDAVEVGFEWLQSLGDARLRLKGLGFFNRFTNPIAMVDATGNQAPYVNRPEGVQVFGLEGEARVEFQGPRSAVWLNSSWFRAEDLGAAVNGRLLTDQPQLRLNAGISLPLGPWLTFDVIVRHASERRSNARTPLEQRRRYALPPTLLVGAQLRTEPLFDRVELILLGQNVFDLQWADDAARPDRMPVGVPREPVQVFGTIRVSL